MTHKEYAKGLRQLAKWYDDKARTGLLLPYEVNASIEEVSFNVTTRDEVAAIIRAFKGGWDREVSYGLAYFRRRERFGPFKVRVYAPRRTVCEAVVVGQKVVPAEPLKIIPATPERTEDIIEWQCKSVLAGENTI